MAVLIIDCYIELFGIGFIQVLYLGRAPRTKETLPIFVRNVGSPDIHECFHGLTGSQRTPRFGASQSHTKINHFLSNPTIPATSLLKDKGLPIFHETAKKVYSSFSHRNRKVKM